MIKVCILDRCEVCDSEAYIFNCEMIAKHVNPVQTGAFFH